MAMTGSDKEEPRSGASSRDLFGDARAAESAKPGSYGLAPPGFRLPAATRLGPVRLQIADLERSLAYYQSVLGLQLLERGSQWARLGTPTGTTLVALEERPGLAPSPARGRTGLFHFAILVPGRAALGGFARHLARNGVPAGAADHLVSEALYLQDPDNLGIEVYADRPESTWRRLGRELVMATDPLDLGDLMAAAGGESWLGVPDGTVIGHVHLHVGDLEHAALFYSDTLGFDRMVWHYPGALFLGAGGYHHHLGTNLWAGRNATPPPADEAQLLHWNIELPHPESWEAARQSLESAGHSVNVDDSAPGLALTTADPWGTVVRLTAAV